MALLCQEFDTGLACFILIYKWHCVVMVQSTRLSSDVYCVSQAVILHCTYAVVPTDFEPTVTQSLRDNQTGLPKHTHVVGVQFTYIPCNSHGDVQKATDRTCVLKNTIHLLVC